MILIATGTVDPIAGDIMILHYAFSGCAIYASGIFYVKLIHNFDHAYFGL